MRRVLLAILVLAAGAVASFAPQPPLDVEPSVLADEPRPTVIATREAPGTIEELRARVGEVLAQERVPGVAIALVGRDGPIWIGGVGVADLETRTPVDAHTVFRVASITKSVVALGVMRLVDQGKLDLDRPLRDLVPDAGVDNAWDDVAPVTLGQVLEHTAGLDDMHPNEIFCEDDALPATAALAVNPRSRVVRWMPGTRHAYANPGYTLAARAIEVATGEPFDTYLRRQILVPMGMPDADFRRSGNLASRLATGYYAPGHAATYRPIVHRPAGALLASATDLAHLVELFLRRRPGIVSPAALARIERSATLPYPHIDADYGLGIGGDVSHPVLAHGHDGGLPGFLSTMRYFPELGVGYVILFNEAYSVRAYLDVRELVFAYLARGHALPARPAVAPRGPDAGFYAFASPRHELFGFLDRALFGWRATTSDAGVHIDEQLGRSYDVVPTPDGAFRQPHESGSSVVFARGREGQPVMIAGFSYGEAAPWWLAWLRVKLLGLAMMLLRYAPVSAGGMIATALFRRRRVVAFDLVLAPGIAGVCVGLMPRFLNAAAARSALGECNAWTIAVCATTIAFALAAAAGVVSAVRWWRRPDRPPLANLLVPTATIVAAAALALWLGLNGIIGLRTWAW